MGLLLGTILSGVRQQPMWIPIGLCLGLALDYWRPEGADEEKNDDTGKE